MGSYMSKEVLIRDTYYLGFLEEMHREGMYFFYCEKSALTINSLKKYIYVKDMDIIDMVLLLSKYGDCYHIYCDKNINKIMFKHNNVHYEFRNTYKNDINILRMGCDIITGEKIILDGNIDTTYIRPIDRKGDVDDKYFCNMGKILRYFYVASFYGEGHYMHNDDLKRILEYCSNNKDECKNEYARTIAKICEGWDINILKIFILMYDCKVFDCLGIHFHDFREFVNDCVMSYWSSVMSYGSSYYKMIYHFLNNIDTGNNYYGWIKSMNFYNNIDKKIIYFIYFYKEICKVKNIVDLRECIFWTNTNKYNYFYKIKNECHINEALEKMEAFDNCKRYKKMVTFDEIEKYDFPYDFGDVYVESRDIYKYRKSNLINLIMSEKIKNDTEEIAKSDLVVFY